MKLKDYAKKITELAEQYPDLKVIYSSDDEGNDFRDVIFNPTAGKLEHGTFCPNDGEEGFKINAVCIN